MSAWTCRQSARPLIRLFHVSPNDLADAFATVIGKACASGAGAPLWSGLFRLQGMKNPGPRMRMLDGFDEGWIEFQDCGRKAIKGQTSAVAVIAVLVAGMHSHLGAEHHRELFQREDSHLLQRSLGAAGHDRAQRKECQTRADACGSGRAHAACSIDA
jgi:hypothetical protein